MRILKNTLFSFVFLFLTIQNFYAQKQELYKYAPKEVREFFVTSLLKIGDPVLMALSKNELKKQLPEANPNSKRNLKHVMYLEAFGRLLSGMAPWLELGPDETDEGKLRAKYINLAQKCIHNATNPEAADFMNFTTDKQPLVDAAFFAQALIRAPNQLWEPLDAKTKANVIKALKATRVIKPHDNNWLLFSGMVEAALLKFDASADRKRLDYGLKKHEAWYLGDGMYGDGNYFRWDYYNSFVIQPMLLDILKTMIKKNKGHIEDYNKVLKRAKRYASIQERLISPDGTYPPIGRSIAYRFGAFQLLSQIALFKELPEEIKPAQVRSALHLLIENQLNAKGTFDENGWLQIGFYGAQPNLGESYISTGSLYLCSEVFLVLGLPTQDSFWNTPYEPWTQKKIWSGQNISIDHALKND
ncbi:DUF2264 domain-containing protein [Polaribacter glomeratus]|jgi:hypothetical protein|uniref:DUF2264 domain-containing protein n=1 Tax=Polaribacter glomeratus TaxID=102 RepID=A0A2S7WHN5_9FLAO|nr:DUF2264 domain-containing protein [Polaribacter glomeratus]PQJ77123.1 hypothetical protein BTO16_14850 [Polaribacter glomeratus]TXD67026.1 DUF2264 domain-containing protein [Polaribacter glomeratus]